jgi:hypothetical protein
VRSRCRRHDCAKSDGFDVADADTRGSKVRGAGGNELGGVPAYVVCDVGCLRRNVNLLVV